MSHLLKAWPRKLIRGSCAEVNTILATEFSHISASSMASKKSVPKEEEDSPVIKAVGPEKETLL
jgi:hypothetical protein